MRDEAAFLQRARATSGVRERRAAAKCISYLSRVRAHNEICILEASYYSTFVRMRAQKIQKTESCFCTADSGGGGGGEHTNTGL